MKNHDSLSQFNRPINRRSFLRLSGIASLGVVSASMIPVSAEAIRFNRKTYKVSRTRLAMGTFVSMTLIHPSRDKAEEGIGRAFEEIDRLTRTLSRFDQATAIAQLNREGYLEDVPPEVSFVIGKSLGYYKKSKGAFDISVKPVVDLFKEKFSKGEHNGPDVGELNKVLSFVGSDMIRVQNRKIIFDKPGMGITLDGIAKGYIVDKASEVLASHNIENYLINAGGDIRTSGSNREKRPWTIAIQDPGKNRKYPDIIKMNAGAIATSGNYEVYFDKEKMFHHIVDPKTGLSPQTNVSVSVRSDRAMDADALSTSVFIMDSSQGIEFVDSLPSCECLLISGEGHTFRSGGWRSAAI